MLGVEMLDFHGQDQLLIVKNLKQKNFGKEQRLI
jgi:hypothetical protein